MSPAEMLQIFSKNIVRIQPIRGLGPSWMDYLKVTPSVCTGEVERWGSGATCPVMEIETAESHDAGAFVSWICDYDSDAVNYKTLSNSRQYCFTATMNGCTFGIGTRVGGGVVTVSHSNAVTLGGGSLRQQAVEQKSLASSVSPEGVRLFQPIDYNFNGHVYTPSFGGHGQLNTTTFGLLINNDWRFYYQQYIQIGRRCLLKTFKEIDMNSLTIVISD